VDENRKCLRRCAVHGPIAYMRSIWKEIGDASRTMAGHVQYAEEFLGPWIGLDWIGLDAYPTI
jgi:hypothetical protein